MVTDRKCMIIEATLDLAAEHGLRAVTLNMIADKVGIKKPSLYNHFSSKEQLMDEAYVYLREKAKLKTGVSLPDYDVLFDKKTACEVLKTLVDGYDKMTSEESMLKFYKVVYSERCYSPIAAKIMAEETEKMIGLTKQIFYAMEVRKLLHFRNPDLSATEFAFVVCGLLDYSRDKVAAIGGGVSVPKKLRDDYIENFCEEHSV